MDRSAVIRTIDWERLRKVPDLHPFEKAHHSKQTVQIPLFAIASPPPPPLAVAAKAAPAACGKNRGKSSGRRSNRSRRSREATKEKKQGSRRGKKTVAVQ